MAGEDGTSEGREGVDFKWVGDGVKTKKFFTKAEKEAMKSSAPKSSAKPKARPEPTVSAKTNAPAAKKATRPTSRPEKVAPAGPTTRGGPRRKAEAAPANPRRGGTRNDTPSNKPFAGTKPTKAELDNMSLAQKLRWGVLFSGGTESAPESSKSGTTAGRRDRRAARRSQSGYAKGGMVKANCGASMKPTQKSTKK